MKTYRDLLLERHASAQSDLDAIRKIALGNLPNSQGSSQPIDAGQPIAWVWSLLDLLLPGRRFIIGLATAWGIVLGLNAIVFQLSDTGPSTANRSRIPDPALWQLAKTERREMLSSLAADSPLPDPGSPDPTSPKPRLAPTSKPPGPRSALRTSTSSC